jgi:hypothetical protein
LLGRQKNERRVRHVDLKWLSAVRGVRSTDLDLVARLGYRIKRLIEFERKGYEIRFETVIPRDADKVLVCFYNCGIRNLNRCITNRYEELCGVLLCATPQHEHNVTQGKMASLLERIIEQDMMDDLRGCERLLVWLRSDGSRARILRIAVSAHEKARCKKQNCGCEAHLVSLPDRGTGSAIYTQDFIPGF